jgi:23S rRNA (cytidine1920-2'-O)/16S rRNA (cytidine1409-2'-O)-methyltransferase
MPRRVRLDAELVRRGLARSRTEAAELIAAGRVVVAGRAAAKPATGVAADEPLTVTQGGPSYASRGGAKLAAALDSLGGPAVAGRRCLDAGASTGGFTDVLLRAGAREVIAVDVGYGQLLWRLRSDPRVIVLDRTNARELSPQLIGGPVDLAVCDLSFISLTLVLPAVAGCVLADGDVLALVKPQFEVGRQLVGPRGVVRDPTHRAQAVQQVAAAAAVLGLGVAGVCRSALPGPAGNVEFFLWLRTDAPPLDPRAVETVVST